MDYSAQYYEVGANILYVLDSLKSKASPSSNELLWPTGIVKKIHNNGLLSR